MTREPFAALRIPDADRWWLGQARVPACLLASPVAGAAADPDGALLLDLLLDRGQVAAIRPAATVAPTEPAVDLGGRQVWPALVDMHAHLDKGHTIPRAQNRDGSFEGAIEGVREDRPRYWTLDDVSRRMEFALRCAHVHGVAAIRTHIDSYEPQAPISWAAVRTLRDRWAGRIALQAVALVSIDVYREPWGRGLADLVADSGGVLGAVTRDGAGGDGHDAPSDTDALLDRLFQLAAERGLDVDLHVDETGDPRAAALGRVADAVRRTRFRGRVVCGHCCSLAVQDEAVIQRTLARCADAGIAIVTLPTVNMYLQDRGLARTPRWRGVTPVHELRAAGIPVAIAGDNCRDPFHAYGDHDMVDTFRQAVRILHLDHPVGDAPALVGPVPAGIIQARGLGTIAEGAPARMILFNARSYNELLSRPQADRIVLDHGRRITDPLPDYSELDGL